MVHFTLNESEICFWGTIDYVTWTRTQNFNVYEVQSAKRIDQVSVVQSPELNSFFKFKLLYNLVTFFISRRQKAEKIKEMIV